MRRLLLLFATALLVLAAPLARATAPATTSYQGILSDSLGNAVPNGSYTFVFNLYTVPTGGGPLWNETQGGITVSAGRFSVLLGAVNPVVTALDQPLWLGIAVNGGPEMSPRVPLASATNALSLRLPATMVESSTDPLLFLRNTGPNAALSADPSMVAQGAANGGVYFAYSDSASGSQAGTQVWGGGSGLGANLLALDNGIISSALTAHPGNHSGLCLVRGGSGVNWCRIDGDNAGTGSPMVDIKGTGSRTIFDSNQSGDAAVQLPAGSVGPTEIRGMPGLAESRVNGAVAITNTSWYQTVDSVYITIPYAGYIHVTATGQGVFWGTAGSNYLAYEIGEYTFETLDPNYALYCGLDPAPGTGAYYLPMHAERVFYKPAGSYGFLFEAVKTGTGNAQVNQPSICATYYPAAYGSVLTAASGGTGVARGTVATSGATSPGRTVDLRDLELQALRARADADARERALADARAGAAMRQLQAGVLPQARAAARTK